MLEPGSTQPIELQERWARWQRSSGVPCLAMIHSEMDLLSNVPDT